MRRAAWALVLAGCSGGAALVDPALGPGARAAFAVTRDGELRAHGLVDAGGPMVASAEDGDVLTLYTLDPSAFSGPLSEATLALAPRADGCGRCLAPAERAPQPLHAGSACPVPPFAPARALRYDAGDALPAEVDPALASRLLLEAPGPCACELAPEPVTVAPLEARALWPVDEAMSIDLAAVAADGAIAAVNAHQAAIVGARTSVHVFSPSLGRPLALGPAPGGGFLLVAEEAGGGQDEPELLLIDAAGARRVAHAGRVEAFAIRASGDELLLAGREVRSLNQRVASVHRCRLDAATPSLACELEPLDTSGCTITGSAPIRDILELPGGEAFAVADGGQIFTRVGGTWRCDARSDALELDDPVAGRLRVSRLLFAGALGERRFACGFAHPPRDPERRVAVVLSWMSGEPRLRALGVDASCTGFSRAGRDRLRVLLRGGVLAADLDAGGELVARYEGVGAQGALFPELPGRLEALDTIGSSTIARTVDGATYHDGVRLFGPAASSDAEVAGFLDEPGGGAVAVLSDGHALRVVRTGGRLSVESATVAGLPSGARRVARRGAEALVVADDRVSWLGPGGASAHAVPEVSDAALLDEETAIAVTAAGEVYELSRGAAPRRLTIDFDDPSTPAREAAPELLAWSYVSASHGVAWLAGPDALARVVAGAGAVEGWWRGRLAASGFGALSRVGPPRLGPLVARCPDDLALLAREAGPPPGADSAVSGWSVGARCGGLACPLEGYAPSGPSAGGPTEDARALVFGEDGAMTVLFEGGTIERAGTPRLVAPFGGLTAATALGPDLVFGGARGRLGSASPR